MPLSSTFLFHYEFTEHIFLLLKKIEGFPLFVCLDVHCLGSSRIFTMIFLVSIDDLQAFAELLQAPQDDAKVIIRDRFPVPRLVVCDQHGSQVYKLF